MTTPYERAMQIVNNKPDITTDRRALREFIQAGFNRYTPGVGIAAELLAQHLGGDIATIQPLGYVTIMAQINSDMAAGIDRDAGRNVPIPQAPGHEDEPFTDPTSFYVRLASTAAGPEFGDQVRDLAIAFEMLPEPEQPQAA